MKYIIAGGRKFCDSVLMNRVLRKLLTRDDSVIVGGAPGADTLGQDWADYHQLDYEVMKANWSKYGKRAGVLRNAEMAEAGDALVAFWDGESKGTRHMIDTALSKGLEVHVYPYR